MMDLVDEGDEGGFWGRMPDDPMEHLLRDKLRVSIPKEASDYGEADNGKPIDGQDRFGYRERVPDDPYFRTPVPGYSVPTVQPPWATSGRNFRGPARTRQWSRPHPAWPGKLRGGFQPSAATPTTDGATHLGSQGALDGSDSEPETHVRFEKRPRVWYYEDRHRTSTAGPSGYDGYETPAWLRDEPKGEKPLDYM